MHHLSLLLRREGTVKFRSEGCHDLVRFVASGVKVHRLTVDLRRVRAGWSAVGETGIPGVTVECVDIGKNTNGEGRSLGRY